MKPHDPIVRLICTMTRWDFFVWLLAPGLVIAAGAATIAAFRRDRRVVAGIGVAATLMAVYVMVQSWTADSSGFEDLALAAVYFYFAAPLTLIAGIGALWRRRATS